MVQKWTSRGEGVFLFTTSTISRPATITTMLIFKWQTHTSEFYKLCGQFLMNT